jgi:hypothetical protein
MYDITSLLLTRGYRESHIRKILRSCILRPNVDQIWYGLGRIAIIFQMYQWYFKSFLLTYESARFAASPKFTFNSTNLATQSFLFSLSRNTAVSPDLIPKEITADCQIGLAIEQLETSLDHTSTKLLIAGTPAIAADALPCLLGLERIPIESGHPLPIAMEPSVTSTRSKTRSAPTTVLRKYHQAVGNLTSWEDAAISQSREEL